jgi:hypothetical protein
MILLDPLQNSNTLIFRFPEVHPNAHLAISFQRTLRIPDDGKLYRLPPGLGALPLRHIQDFAGRLSPQFSRRGGVIMPLHQSEATWISFRTGWRGPSYPMAVKVAAGKINALTGEPWSDGLSHSAQDYMVVPDQPWLDGFHVTKDVIRQFVAAPLGSGITVEEQLSGKAEWGGLQIAVFPMRADRYEELLRRREAELEAMGASFSPVLCAESAMGLAAGGRMFQQIFQDPYGLDAWERDRRGRCFVSILNAEMWTRVTGEIPPTRPPTVEDYNAAGLPWFSYYAPGKHSLPGSSKLSSVQPVDAAPRMKACSPDNLWSHAHRRLAGLPLTPTRALLLFLTAILVASCLVPPWTIKRQYPAGVVRIEASPVYAPLWSPPARTYRMQLIEVDSVRLLLQGAILAGLMAVVGMLSPILNRRAGHQSPQKDQH